MNDLLQADILKLHDNLQNIKFKVNDNEYKFYFRHLTILEHTRIKLACTKENVTISPDGRKTIKLEENEHLYPIYTVLEKALDENGKKLYSLTDANAFQMFSKMPFHLLSHIASEMSFDIAGNIKELMGKENGE